MIIKRTHENKFTIICNDMLQNASLSWAARGLLGYMLSLPHDWSIHEKELLEHTTNGKTATHTAMKELIATGYVYKVGERERTVYYIDEFPHEQADWEQYLGEQGTLPEINQEANAENRQSHYRNSGMGITENRQRANAENRQIQSNQDKVPKKRNHKKGPPIGTPPLPNSLSPLMEEAERLAHLLIREHRKEVPNYLSGKDEQTVSRWKLDIEKLLRIDGKSAEDIEAVISWVKRPDNFWFANIISGSKLREKYEQLYSDMVMEGRRQRTKQRKTPPSTLADKKSLRGLDSW